MNIPDSQEAVEPQAIPGPPTLSSEPAPSSRRDRFALWATRVGLGRKLAIALAVLAVLAGTATYLTLTGSSPLTASTNSLLLLLNIDLVLLLSLGGIIARRIVQIWAERRRGSAGSRLHVRLVVLFSALAATPAIVVAVFSALFFNLGVESWFDDRVRTAVRESLAVAEAYVQEHQNVIRGEILAMANDINREGGALLDNPQRLNALVETQALLRSLTEAIIFDQSGRVIARSRLSFVLEFEPIPPESLERARNGEPVIFVSDTDDRVRALVKLDGLFDAYLYVGRFVDPKVINHMEKTQDAVQAYETLEARRGGLQITFAMIFVMVALLLLLAAVWVGLALANQLAKPISALINAAERVRAGDLTAHVDEGAPNDELGSLSRAFNRMTSQLSAQRSELVEANRQVDTRRRFMEAVLSGVSAGVVGLDADANINFPNRSAVRLLGSDLYSMIGRPLAEALPEIEPLLEAARKRPNRLHETQIDLVRDGRFRTLLVRIAAEDAEESKSDGIAGYVATFDDITEMLSAQRKATWSDVARRLAHEIKNPLTPIQLSAERLRRKYLAEVTSDPQTFNICIDTIIRQVDDIGGMIDEFSSFARMPAPVLKEWDLAEVVRQSLFLQQSANPDIVYHDEVHGAVSLLCDARQISQALTNLLKNAAESIRERLAGNTVAAGDNPGQGNGEIRLALEEDETRLAVVVEDNGLGLPPDKRHRLTDPYVTTKSTGTGLGLAIVRKIMEDHGGELLLEDRPEGGARVSLIFKSAEIHSSLETPSPGAESHLRDAALTIPPQPPRKIASHES
ncbi:MAG TPA: PAS domain-containing sensor histidine kinase [Alphaproteobacteria bacterium]|jgi:two-component system nitrogen regulation sensor histidine kinase NtrY